jgi:50S ribosomal protein L16 3-hydroxylase
VQAVDHWLPELAELRSAFNFIPNWRVDDVMASYATRGGCVGPHFDQYDVFLVQAAGTRQWQVGQHCTENDTLRKHPNLKLLADFNQQTCWTLEPGDILYLPPGFAHWGIAQDDDCITYSVGFRAPSCSDLVANYCDDVLSKLCEDQRYSDPDLALQDNPGLISTAAIDQAEAIIRQLLLDREQLQQWFGRYMTEPKYRELHQEQGIEIEQDELLALLTLNPILHRNPAARCAFTDAPSFIFYVDGEAHMCNDAEQALARQLCKQSSLDTGTLSMPACASLIHTLFCQGVLYFDDGDD